LSAGHARALLSLPENSLQEALADEIIRKGLSVREAERRAKGFLTPPPQKTKAESDPFVEDLETRLERRLGAKVRISVTGKKGSIKISFFDFDELDGLIQKICP
jgi:ParB family chromosome partitioning protein